MGRFWRILACCRTVAESTRHFELLPLKNRWYEWLFFFLLFFLFAWSKLEIQWNIVSFENGCNNICFVSVNMNEWICGMVVGESIAHRHSHYTTQRENVPYLMSFWAIGCDWWVFPIDIAVGRICMRVEWARLRYTTESSTEWRRSEIRLHSNEFIYHLLYFHVLSRFIFCAQFPFLTPFIWLLLALACFP